MLVARLVGWEPRGGATAIGWLVVLAMLGTAAFGSLGLLIAGMLRAEATLAVANLVYVMLLVGGGLIVPLERYPGSTHHALELLPSGALGQGLRDAFNGALAGPAPGGRSSRLGARGRLPHSEDVPVGVRTALLAPDRHAVERWAWASVVANTLIVLTGGSGAAHRFRPRLPHLAAVHRGVVRPAPRARHARSHRVRQPDVHLRARRRRASERSSPCGAGPAHRPPRDASRSCWRSASRSRASSAASPC